MSESLIKMVDMKRKCIALECRADRLEYNSRFYSSDAVASELGFESVAKFYTELTSMGLGIENESGEWMLYPEYSETDFYVIRIQGEYTDIDNATYYIEWTGMGRDWLRGIFYRGDK